MRGFLVLVTRTLTLSRDFRLKAEDLSTCGRPQSTSAALKKKPLVHRVPK